MVAWISRWKAVAEAIPSLGTWVPSRHPGTGGCRVHGLSARYLGQQGRQVLGWPEAAKRASWRPMRVGTGAVLAEAEAGGNAVHEVGK